MRNDEGYDPGARAAISHLDAQQVTDETAISNNTAAITGLQNSGADVIARNKISAINANVNTVVSPPTNFWTSGDISISASSGTWRHNSYDFTNLVPLQHYNLFITNIVGSIATPYFATVDFYNSGNSQIGSEYAYTAAGTTLNFALPTGTAKVTINLFLCTSVAVSGATTAYFYGIQLTHAGDAVTISDQFQIILPILIKLSANKPINLYYDNILYKSYRKDVSCLIQGITGLNNYKRQAAGTPTGADKYQEAFSVYYTSGNLNRNSIGSLYCKVVDATSRTAKSLKVLAVGDSFAEMGYWIDGLVTKAAVDGVTINTIGLMDTLGGLGVSENQTGGTLLGSFMSSRTEINYKVTVSGLSQKTFNIHYGSYATYTCNGYTWTVTGAKIDTSGNGYIRLTCAAAGSTLNATGTLTKLAGTGDASIAFTGAEVVNRNPFWNNGTSLLDFSYYINKWGFSSPDVLVFMFGWNDYQAWSDITTFVSSVQAFITKFLTQYPSAHVIFMVPPYGYTGQPQLDVDGIKSSRLLCAKLLYQIYLSSTSVDIVPAYAFVDHINGYDTSTTQPCSWYTETIPTNGGNVHNNQNGMYQISDAVYPYVADLLT